MKRDVKFFIDWFDTVASAMKAKPSAKLTNGEMKSYFIQSGREMEVGVAYDPNNTMHANHVDRCLEHALPRFQRLGLIAVYYDRNRYTPNMGFHVPENVAELTKRGERLSNRPMWYRKCYWTASVLAERVTETASKYKWVLTVATTSLAVTKLVLEWDLLASGLVAASAAILTVVINALH